MHPLLLTAWLACQAFDGVSTQLAFNNGRQEGNVLMSKGHVPIRVSINVGAFLVYRRTKTKTIPIVLTISGCASGVWNVAKK